LLIKLASSLFRQAQGNIATVNLLLEKGANVNFKNPQGMTPISWAVDEDNHAVANLLIAKGAKEGGHILVIPHPPRL
jgi:ankyrin repeat protein